MIEQFSKVKLKTDRFEEIGLMTGTLAYVLEVFDDGGFEIEIPNQKTGGSIAIINVCSEDIEKVDIS